MKLLDLLSGRKDTNSPEHNINPVYDTAKNCLVNLAKAQCREAIRLNNVLRFTDDTDSVNKITKGTALFQEVRYRFVNTQIKKTNIHNILDIGCGYSPRGILFAEQGYSYVGADLPAAIKEVEPAALQCLDSGKDKVKYVGLDATDPEALVQAASHLDGPVCIVTEGIMMYFPAFELNEFVKGLRRVLELHGGCIITPDFCMNRLLKLSSSAATSKAVGEVLQFGATRVVKEYYISSSDEMDPSRWYAEDGDQKPYDYFIKKGFKIERISVYDPDMQIFALKNIKEKRIDKLIEGYKNTYGWKITLQ